MKTKHVNPKNDERGAIVLLMAVALVALIGVASLAIDIGSALVTKAELQNVADASSLAATRQLGLIYKVVANQNNKTDFNTYVLDNSQIEVINRKADDFAEANKAAGVSIELLDADVQRLSYDEAKGAFVPSQNDVGVRSIRVAGRRDDTINEAVSTTLARVIGINQIAIRSRSASVLSAVGRLKKGEGDFPIGIDEAWFDNHACSSDERIKLIKTQESCAGWHSFDNSWQDIDNDVTSKKNMVEMIEQLQAGTFTSPDTGIGDTYNFIGGQVSPVWEALEDLFWAKGGPGWVVNIPVYADTACKNPQNFQPIVGFARAKIWSVVAKNPDPSNKEDDERYPKAELEVVCGILDGDVAGGGGPPDNPFGTLVSTPSMIE